MGFKEVNHTADLAFEVWGRNEEELLNSTIELLKVLFGIKSLKRETVKHEIFNYEFIEDLIFEAVNEFIYLFEKHDLFPKKLKFDSKHKKLEVEFSKVVEKSEDEFTELKALTYHRLKINRSEGVLRTYLIFDV